MATLLLATGEKREISPRNGKKFSLKELQKHVGGYVELMGFSNGHTLVMDEEGRLKGLPMNREATRIAARLGYDYIVGDVLDCRRGEI